MFDPFTPEHELAVFPCFLKPSKMEPAKTIGCKLDQPLSVGVPTLRAPFEGGKLGLGYVGGLRFVSRTGTDHGDTASQSCCYS